MNILILAYACEPLKGSEPGVGWNLPITLAKYHHIFVLTRRNNREVINTYISSNPVDNIGFEYHDLPNSLMWIKKVIGIQFYYFLWNISAYWKVRKIIKKNNIELVHHLTFNQYRTPSSGYFINLPFIVGPIGGAELINKVFDEELGKKTLYREGIRRKGKDRLLFRLLGMIRNNKKAFIFSAQENLIRLSPYINRKRDIISLLPSIAVDKKDFLVNLSDNHKHDVFTMIYAGRAIDWKGLHFFILALGQGRNIMSQYKVKLIGIRTKEERDTVNKWIIDQGLSEYIELVNFIPRDELLKSLCYADLFVYPAFRDSGSMAVLEASAVGCPSIVFNAGGQDAFPDGTIIKVDIEETYKDTLSSFTNRLLWCYGHRNELRDIGKNARSFAFSEMTWENKAILVDKLYKRLVI